jgi:hypothetical protein
MADTTYVDGVTPITADTMNDFNRLHYTILADPANAAGVNTALGLGTGDTPNFSGVRISGQKLQGFVLQLNNDAGTLKHAIYSEDGGGAAATYADKISGASTTPTATPTGDDASTNFAAGAKISSAATNALVLNTGGQTVATAILFASISLNDTGADLTVGARLVSRNINGTTAIRLEFAFRNAGAAFALNTTNITNGQFIYVPFIGVLA